MQRFGIHIFSFVLAVLLGTTLANAQEQETREETLNRLLKEVGARDFNTTIDAGIKLREMVKPDDLETLTTALRQLPSVDGRFEIITAIEQLHDRRASEALKSELEKGSGSSQREAARALGRLQSDWAIPPLYEAMRKGNDIRLRIAAACALGELGTPRAIQSLETGKGVVARRFRNAVEWASSSARGEIDRNRIDGNLEWGKKLSLWHKGLSYYYYSPSVRERDSKPWLLVIIHGEDLDANEIFDTWLPIAKKHQAALLVPFFDPIAYDSYDTFNLRGLRSDRQLLDLIDYVGAQTDVHSREVLIAGEGQGGNFVQRFIAAYPSRIIRAVFNGQDLASLNTELYFPKGLKTTPLAPDLKIDFYRALKTDALLVTRANTLKERTASRELEELYRAFNNASALSGISHRYRLQYDVAGSPEDSLLKDSSDYLFPPPPRPPKISN